MGWTTGGRARLRHLLRRAAAEERMDEEIRFHIEMETEKNLRSGMDPAEARRRARIAFGGVEGHREEMRRGRRLPLLEDGWRDLRHAARGLLRSRGFTVAAVLTLALGIGGATGIFGVVDAVVLRPLAFPDADRIQLVWTRSEARPESWLSYPEWTDLREQGSAFADVAALRDASFAVTGEAEPEQVAALAVSANLFSVLGVGPALGRGFLPAEDRTGAGRVAILSDGLWRRRYGGDPGIVGRAIPLDGEPHTVVGVLPPGFRLLPPSSVFPREAAVLVPLEPLLGTGVLRDRDVRHLHVLGRIGPGVSAAQARAEVERIGERLRREHAGVYTAPGWGMYAVGYREHLVREVRPALLILLGAAGFLLLLVIVNVTNLLLVRDAARVRERAVRAALGASRVRLAAAELAESLVLVLAGALGGVLIAGLGLDVLRALGPESLPRLDEARIDGRVLGVGLLLALGSVLALALVPVLHAARGDAGEALRESARGASAGRRSGRARRALVVAQVSLALVLLVGTGLLTRSLLHLQAAPTGFDPTRVLTLQLPLSDARHPPGRERAAFLAGAEERLRTLPGVRAVGAVTQLPLSGAHLGSGFLPEPAAADGELPFLAADLRGVTPGYFRAMGVPLLRGRGFTDADARDAPRVAVVDETLAARFWPGEDPVGQRIRWQRAPEPIEVVGVAAAVRHAAPGQAPRETVYRPYAQYSPATPVFLAVRADGDPAALAAALRREIHGLDPDQPIAEVVGMQERVRRALDEPRFYSLLLGVFAGAALFLAALGIYGVVSIGVAQRTREIGIRTALGASRRDVLRLVLREGLRLSLLGVAGGVLAAIALTRVLAGLLHEVSATDPLVFALVPVLLTAAALLACYLPARRAARVDPTVALRAE
jgi:putative ABC transport system permease protein